MNTTIDQENEDFEADRATLNNMMSNIEMGADINPDDIIENLWHKKEPIRDWFGNVLFNEHLADFWDKISTHEWLQILKTNNKTFDLYLKQLLNALYSINESGEAASVNLYLKDISSPYLVSETERYLKKYDIDPSNLVLEVLEYNYWELDQAIPNLKALSKKWYNFAIDDFSLEYDPQDLSFDNLATLLRHDITPNYVKIDWKYLWKVLNWWYDENHIREFRIIIKFLKSKWIKIIWEWIWNEEEWYIAKSLWVDLFQWKYLDDNFSLKPNKWKPKVESFKLVRWKAVEWVKSFSLYRKERKEKEYQKIALSPKILALLNENKEYVSNIIRF